MAQAGSSGAALAGPGSPSRSGRTPCTDTGGSGALEGPAHADARSSQPGRPHPDTGSSLAVAPTTHETLNLARADTSGHRADLHSELGSGPQASTSRSPGPEADTLAIDGLDLADSAARDRVRASMDAPDRDSDPAGGRQTVYVEGQEVQVTHRPQDGIWVSGLPCEMPGAPYGTAKIGEILAGSEESKESRSERLISKFCDRADDALDITEKRLNEVQKLFGPRPPTSTDAQVRAAHVAADPPYHGIEVGSMATALMALGVAGWGFHQWWKHRQEATRGPEEARG